MSISPDDQGFWDAKGCTLDYVYAFLAWDLTLQDLKQLVENSLEYSSVDEAHKVKCREYFDQRWVRFISNVRSRF